VVARQSRRDAATDAPRAPEAADGP